MERHVKFLRCEVCGNIVGHIKDSGAPLTCCGQHMTVLKANSTDAAQEKHVPVAKKSGDKLNVTVGSVLHPMLNEHFIEWIAVVTDNTVQRFVLAPGEDPKAVAYLYADKGEVYEYCNLHGLWKTEF